MQTLPATLILPSRVVARAAASATLLAECLPLGARGFLIHGRSFAASKSLSRLLAATPPGLALSRWEHPGGEPTLAQLDEALAAARKHRPDWIAAVGGGSVMDIGKACAGLLEAPLPARDYHAGAAIPATRIPFVAVPTTAGTGAEATIVTVLTDTQLGVKKSIRHPSFMARLVILDPDLLTGCPPSVMAASGMDAFTQAVESYISKGATTLTDALALEAVRMTHTGLRTLAAGTVDSETRRLMLEGSFLAGLALSHARLGLVHGLAHPLGLRYHAAHGLVCGIGLPPVLAFNRASTADKFATLSQTLGADPIACADGLLRDLRLVSPFRGQPILDREAIVRETLESGSTAANPRPVTADDVHHLLDQLFAP
jgi:alcohol dehydrogenase class IV